MSLKPLLPDTGPILRYLAQFPSEERLQIQASIEKALSTDEGAILLEVMENAVANRLVPMQADSRALEYLNAQRFIVSDLQRIVRPANAYLEPALGSAKRSR